MYHCSLRLHYSQRYDLDRDLDLRLINLIAEYNAAARANYCLCYNFSSEYADFGYEKSWLCGQGSELLPSEMGSTSAQRRHWRHQEGIRPELLPCVRSHNLHGGAFVNYRLRCLEGV